LKTVKNQLKIPVIIVRFGGLKNKFTEVKAILDKFGIKHETSVPYKSEQNS